MRPIEVLKMIKSKIDDAVLNKCNYVIETSDIEVINQTLLLYGDVEQSEQLPCFVAEEYTQCCNVAKNSNCITCKHY